MMQSSSKQAQGAVCSSPPTSDKNNLFLIEDVISLATLAVPAAFSQFFTILAQSVATMFVGHYLGPDSISAVNVAIRIISTVGVKPGVGMATALDTMSSQEHGRDRHSCSHGLFIKRCLVFQGVLVVLCSICFFAAPLVIRSYFPSPVDTLAPQFVVFGTLYIIPIYFTTDLAKVLQAIGLAKLPTKATMVSTVFCIFYNFVGVSQFAIRGSAMALACTAWTQTIALSAFAFFNPTSRAALISADGHRWNQILDISALKRMMSLGIPSIGIVVGETVPFSTMVIFAGMVGGVDGAAFNVSYAIVNLLFTASYGMSGAIAARMGNALGANRPDHARRLAKTAILMTMTVAVFNIALYSCFKRWLFRLYTFDEAVIQRSSDIVPFACFMHFFDCVQFVFQGIFAACGMNHVGFPILLLTEVAFAIPVAWILTFRHEWGSVGLYCGLASGLAVAFICYVIAVFWHFDLKSIAYKASTGKNCSQGRSEEGGYPFVSSPPGTDATTVLAAEACEIVSLLQTEDPRHEECVSLLPHVIMS